MKRKQLLVAVALATATLAGVGCAPAPPPGCDGMLKVTHADGSVSWIPYGGANCK